MTPPPLRWCEPCKAKAVNGSIRPAVMCQPCRDKAADSIRKGWNPLWEKKP